MRRCLILCQAALITIIITDSKINGVQAEHKVVSLGNLFGSLEKVNLQNIEGTENTPIVELSEPVAKKKIKKRKKFLRKDIEWVPEDNAPEVSTAIKKRRKKKFGKRRFVKTSMKELNTSGSDEHDKRRQPVDIIVHIKMND